jgi:hypothetical protein
MSQFRLHLWRANAIGAYFYLLILFFLIIILSFSVGAAEQLKESSFVGRAIGSGVKLFPRPKLLYNYTTIGDIRFPCQTWGAGFSIMYFYKQRLGSEHLGLWQLEILGTWIQEKGDKNLMLYGYPAKAESEMTGLVFGGAMLFHYLKFWRIWFGSGVQTSMGVTDERFSISLYRGEQEVSLFDPRSGFRFTNVWDGIVLNALMLEGFWSSWDIQLGYHYMKADRPNGYGEFQAETQLPGTQVNGWYIQIRKIFPLDLNWKRIVEVKPEEKP